MRRTPIIAGATLALLAGSAVVWRAGSSPTPAKRPLSKHDRPALLEEPTVSPMTPAPLPTQLSEVRSTPRTIPVSSSPDDEFLQELTDSLREQLELFPETAAAVARLLANRDREAEAILEPHGFSLDTATILSIRPGLLALELRADSEIEALLLPEQRARYRTLREEGFIAGVVLEPPPDMPPPTEDSER